MSRFKIDYIFLFSVIALSAIGLIMILSASPTLAMKHGDAFYYIKRHLFYLLLGAAALYYAFFIKLDNIKKRSNLILIISIALLIMVFIPGAGRKVLGASRWIDLGVLSFQPSELIKFAMVLFLARWLSEKKAIIKDFYRGVLPPLILLLLIGFLIVKQPDLGTFIITAAVFFCLFFIAGMELSQFIFMGSAALVGVIILSLSSPYRFRRIIAYLDPWKDPQGVGFHIIQSLLAVGSGGLFGLGLGSSRQKFFYLPQQFTDFIFAILCEELGFIGGLGVVVLFVIFCVRGFRIALEEKDMFRKYFAAGIVSWITLQALINILVVLGMIPTTGIPLPFISYGGTATIINLFAAGIVLNISRKAQ